MRQAGYGQLSGTGAEYFTHHANQPQGAAIADAIIYAVGILAGCEDALVAQNGEVLRDVALRGTDTLDNILYADLLVTKGAQDFQPQRVRH